MKKPRYITRLEKIPQLSSRERACLKEVTSQFPFRTNEYYQSLIQWDDPEDPVRRIVMPDVSELDEWGELDVSEESAYTAVPGCEHKYGDTALLLVNDTCGAYCRFCFRKRLFMNENDEVVRNIEPGVAYIKNHPEINNVLLTGGDPLLMSTARLENIISRLRAIEHIKIIRIGTKIPLFNPYRVLDDPGLVAMLSRYSRYDRKIYVMLHVNHPRELTGPALHGIDLLQGAGVVMAHQTPLIRGLNDDPEILKELFNTLAFIGVPPYYVFICRPTQGNIPYTVPIEESFEIFKLARKHCSGLAKRARLVMSHATGKIEVLGVTTERTLFKLYRTPDCDDAGEILIYKRNPFAYWLDDYTDHDEGFPADGVEEFLNYNN